MLQQYSGRKSTASNPSLQFSLSARSRSIHGTGAVYVKTSVLMVTILLVDGIIRPAVELLLDLVGVALHGAVDVHVRWHRETLVVPLHQDARDLLELFYVPVGLGLLKLGQRVRRRAGGG